jgi:hypothetical protein
MRNFKHAKFTYAAGACALAAGCTLAVVSSGVANAATEKPAAVSGFAVKAGTVSPDGATFTWDKAARATEYRIVVVNASTPGAAAAFDSGNKLDGLSDTVSTLKPGTAYDARIDAVNSGGGSDWSDWVQFYTTAAPGQKGDQGPSGVVATGTTQLLTDASATSTGTPVSVKTGGSFGTYKTALQTIPLKAGTYLINVNFKATPNASNTNNADVFPQLFVYDGAFKPDFSNDVFNVGSGAVSVYNTAGANDQVDSYYSGSTVITVPAGGTTLNVYAFGYDSDHGGSSYLLDSGSLSATQLEVAPGNS